MRLPTPEWGLIVADNRNVLMISPVTCWGQVSCSPPWSSASTSSLRASARILGRTVRINEA
jgi:hypothetical protein